MKKTLSTMVAVCATAILVASASAQVDEPQGPPPPVAANGNKVEAFATGVAVPTQMTFGAGMTFIAGAVEGKAEGGIYVVKPGSKVATKIPGSPDNAFGVLWRGGKLYVTQNTELAVYSKWNGKRFKGRKILAKGPKTGFSGLAMGPDGRLYTGVQLKQEFDHKANPMKYANTVLSFKTSGKDLRVESKGLRQPWMMAFAKGEKAPIVSDLAQDLPEGTTAPDLLVKAKRGSNFGFPKCNWSVIAKCKGFTKPLLTLPKTTPAASPMGIAPDGKKLYVALFGGLPDVGPGIVVTNTSGAKPKPVVSGFVAPVLSVAIHNGYLYTGDLTGTIHRVEL